MATLEPVQCVETSIESPSSPSDEYVPGTFEGVEKNLEVLFKPETGSVNGCRSMDRAAIDAILKDARCEILSTISTSSVDAYVLSESSLFVYSHKMILKTCGRTTLLRCLQRLLDEAAKLGLELDRVGYTRKNYTFPENQVFPHTDFAEEFRFLKTHPELDARLHGSGYMLGPTTGDHWLAFMSEKMTGSKGAGSDRTFNVMMFELDPTVTPIFYQENTPTATEQLRKCGLDKIVEGWQVDDHAFEPCGYSMNALLGDSYATVHITPEDACSYASFELNQRLESYTPLLKRVLSVFRPGRVVVTMVAERDGLDGVTEAPFKHENIAVEGLGAYHRTAAAEAVVEAGWVLQMANFSLVDKKRNTKTDSDEATIRA